MSGNKKGYIYIMTNPALINMVKIGYATNVEERRKQLSTTALPYEYEVYALMKLMVILKIRNYIN